MVYADVYFNRGNRRSDVFILMETVHCEAVEEKPYVRGISHCVVYGVRVRVYGLYQNAWAADALLSGVVLVLPVGNQGIWG